jgi:hypothetical protein
MRATGFAAIDRVDHFGYRLRMPWIRRQARPRSPYWTVAVIALSALAVGVLIGYTRWGATAAIVTLVEKELAETQAHIKVLEKRMTNMETIIIGDETVSGAPENETGKVKKPEKKTTQDRSKAEKEKQAWNSESRF